MNDGDELELTTFQQLYIEVLESKVEFIQDQFEAVGLACYPVRSFVESLTNEPALIKIVGSRILPTYVFENKLMLGLLSKTKVIIRFEQNFDEITKLLKIEE